MQALIEKAHAIGYLTSQRRTSMDKSLPANGWRIRDRGPDPLPPETTQLPARIVDAALARGLNLDELPGAQCLPADGHRDVRGASPAVRGNRPLARAPSRGSGWARIVGGLRPGGIQRGGDALGDRPQPAGVEISRVAGQIGLGTVPGRLRHRGRCCGTEAGKAAMVTNHIAAGITAAARGDHSQLPHADLPKQARQR